MLCAIWCHWYNFKNVKNTHRVSLLHGLFSQIVQMVPHRAKCLNCLKGLAVGTKDKRINNLSTTCSCTSHQNVSSVGKNVFPYEDFARYFTI